ncbi:hypothetical protein [Aeromonas caviae]|uniref:hypothetical protein n=1 Tax=Aeromonas caviae TaxID=648 RepID=UPI0029D9ECCA|nr:hypothetical protein [Aeromonas caviae]MDX7787734.1 hypothetical protein [Aeromonas caviae]
MIKSLVKFKDKYPDALKRVRSFVQVVALSTVFFACTPVIAKVVPVPSSMVELGKLEYVADLLDRCRCTTPTWMERSGMSTVFLFSRVVLTAPTFTKLTSIVLIKCDYWEEISD